MCGQSGTTEVDNDRLYCAIEDLRKIALKRCWLYGLSSQSRSWTSSLESVWKKNRITRWGFPIIVLFPAVAPLFVLIFADVTGFKRQLIIGYIVFIILATAAFFSISFFMKMNEKEPNKTTVKLARMQMIFYSLTGVFVVGFTVLNVWSTLDLGAGLYGYAAIAGQLAAGFVFLGQFVGMIYVPFRHVSYADLAGVSKFLQSVGWALIPAPFVLLVAQILIQMMEKKEDRVGEVLALFLSLLSWVANFIRTQRQWSNDYTTRREGIAEKLDALLPKKCNELNRSELIDSDEIESLCHLVRVGVSVRCSGVPLVPTEVLSLYVAARIFRCLEVRKFVLKEWKIEEVLLDSEGGTLNQSAPSSTSSNGQPPNAGQDGDSSNKRCSCNQAEYVAWRIMGEIMNAPYYMRKCVIESLADLMNLKSIKEGTGVEWKVYFAADALVRETIVSNGVYAR